MILKLQICLENLFSVKNKTSGEGGFSLIEIIFSLGIVTVSIVSIMSLFNYNLKTEINNKNKLVAAYLAQEQIEIVRQKRDNNWFVGGGTDWMEGMPAGNAVVSLFDTPDNNGPAATYDLRKGWEIKNDGSPNWKKIYSFNGTYVQLDNGVIPANWEETGFERYLKITKNVEIAPNVYSVSGCLSVIDCFEAISYVSLNGASIAEIKAYFYDRWY